MTTWKITARDGHLYVNVPDHEWGEEDTLLLTTTNEGEAIVPSRWNGEALMSLYDLRQTNEAIKDGDLFEYCGRIVAKVDGLHVLPASKSPPLLPSAGWLLYPNPPSANGNFVEDLDMIQSILGSTLYATCRLEDTWYIRRVED